MATKLTKSLPIIKERNCTVSVVLDTRTNRKNVTEYPLALRFTVDRKFFYHPVSGSYTEKQFSDIANATRSGSDNYKVQREWREAYTEKYKAMLQSLCRGTQLTLEAVRRAVTMGTVKAEAENDDASFIGVWEEYIHHLMTDNDGERYTTGESYECALKSFKRILGDNVIHGFNIGAAELQRWKEGMRSGITGPGGKLVGKIKDSTAGIYMRNCRTIWNICKKRGYLQDVTYPFTTKATHDDDSVTIPTSGMRKNMFLTVDQMTQLYNVFVGKNYPTTWTEEYVRRAHYSLGLFLVQYLCNGFNLADAGQLTYDDYYYQTGGRAFHFYRKKTAGRSMNGAEVIVPITPPLQRVLDDIAEPSERNGYVFPYILKGATTEKDKRQQTSQENSNVKDRVTKICHEVLGWDKSLQPSGTWARHSFATNLRHAGIDMDYISESMGHAAKDHAVTQIYIEHYPLETQMENNMKLLNLTTESDERKQLMSRLAALSDNELKQLLAS